LTKNNDHLPAVRAAAAATGLSLDELGRGVGVVVDDLHLRLQKYDIVFSTGRMALESLASGCAVIIADERGLAGLVTSDTADLWRRHNFGQRLLKRSTTTNALISEIERYDSNDARKVSLRVRDVARLSAYLESLEAIYRNVISDRCDPDWEHDLPELSRFYERMLKHTAPEWWNLQRRGPLRKILSPIYHRLPASFRSLIAPIRGYFRVK